MKELVCAIAALLMVGSHSGYGLLCRVSAQEKHLSVAKPVVKEGGWTIPGLEESQISTPRKLLPAGYGPSSAPVYVTVLRPKEKFITTVPLYRVKDGQTVLIGERKVMVDIIMKCDVNDRVFAYILQCTTILEEPNGRTGYSGMFGVHYTDRDGDGEFESMEEGAPFLTSDLQIPDWVLQ